MKATVQLFIETESLFHDFSQKNTIFPMKTAKEQCGWILIALAIIP